MCEFQVRRIFDVSFSLEKLLDRMVMFNDGRASVLTFQFSLGTVLSNHSAWQVKYHITQWASISAKIPIFQNLRGFMEKSTRASVQLFADLPFLFFFVPYRLPGIDLTLSCNRPALSLDLLYPESVRCCMYSQFFC